MSSETVYVIFFYSFVSGVAGTSSLSFSFYKFGVCSFLPGETSVITSVFSDSPSRFPDLGYLTAVNFYRSCA